MRTRLMILSVTAFVVAACGGGSDSTGPGTTTGGTGGGGGGSNPVATTAVEMKGFAFSPTAIKVGSGATVTWTNSDGVLHNVTFDGGAALPSGNFDSGAKALVMPTAAGVYTYKCTLHAGMNGSVTVQ